jgi:hypothetical protein
VSFLWWTRQVFHQAKQDTLALKVDRTNDMLSSSIIPSPGQLLFYCNFLSQKPKSKKETTIVVSLPCVAEEQVAYLLTKQEGEYTLFPCFSLKKCT